ncbi:calponin homology domain-containing protein DDB_G0272472-like isoform X43 [Diachasmimorpha longicaudata]|uniref:calponin homology domain-containing protein DDB_G0272472-like isoform X43 n=1 Tax=Diachasmimorpha longicaudata TaxID=58733 RepID=UPI0030B8BD9B
MFSELCRETLRKAAVCYSAGRSGSPTQSPPTSPPPSPAKEAKIITNVELANVHRTNDQVRDTAHNPSKSQQNQGTSTADTDTREVTHKNSNTTEDRKRRTSMLTNFGKRSPERRRIRYTMSDEYRSASVERDYYTNRENRYEPYYRDYRRYRRDSSGSSSEQDDSSTSGDEAGAAPEETNERSNSAYNRHSLTKEQTMHWFANVGGDEDSLNWSDSKRRSLYDEDSLDGDHPNDKQGRESAGSAKDLDRVKLVRERQNEERQRKLEELRNQALAAQRFREQREEERRRRIDELRSRDMDRRTQVEERKRLIYEAERERREAILRKNQEREARIEAKKKNERSHIVFAFGSSTPRMLEPADTGGSSFWGTRRATSTTNVMMFPAAQPLTRRSSERELDGSKKRATSAGGLDRKPGEGVRSGEVTPNSPSRPHSSMSQQSGSSVASSNVNLRPRTSTPRRPRPASIAGTGVTVTERNNLGEVKAATKDSKPPLPKVHTTPKKPSTPRTSAETPRKPGDRLIKSAKASPRVTPKATPLQSPGSEQPPLIRQNTTEIIKNYSKEVGEIKVEEEVEEKRDQGSEKCQDTAETNNSTVESVTSVEAITVAESTQDVTSAPAKEEIEDKKSSPEAEQKTESDAEEIVDMSASMIAKIRITTEEEAKAALAERRRLAREQAEKEAEIERQRLEEEERLEMERQRAEEEEQRRLEEETLRLASEAREAEEQRLQLAIEDAKRREEEDRKRREEEARQKLEKEEAERKAREEAEKQRLEMVERLKKEEEERIARRKRVEAIMKRTRGGNNQANTTTKGDNGDGDKSKDESPSDECKPMPGNKTEDVMTASLISEATQQLINAEQQDNHPGNNSPPDIVRNGTTHSNGINDINKALLENNQSNVEGELNGHHTNHGNGISSQITLDNATVKQNNVTNNLLDLSEFDTLSNSNKGPILEMSTNLSNEDSLNSNLNPGAMPFTPMVNPFVPAATNANTNPFQDNFTNNKTQDNNQLPDLLS